MFEIVTRLKGKGTARSLLFLAGLLLHGEGGFAEPEPHVFELREVLTLSEKTDPNLGAAVARTSEAQHSVEIARSAYYPKLDLQALDTTGFPASSPLTGVGGLMASPFSTGFTYGAVANMIVFDFGRTSHGIGVAQQSVRVSKEDYRVRRISIYGGVLGAFFDCVRYRTEEGKYRDLSEEARRVVTEVSRFVQTGQKSIVDRYLVETQKEQIDVAQAAFLEDYRGSLADLKLLTQSQDEQNECPMLDDLSEDQIVTLPKDELNPFVARAEAEAAQAREQVDQVKADFLPKFTAVGSVGGMQGARVVSEESYAAGVGLIVPLFEGFRTKSELGRAHAKVMETDYRIKAAQEQIDVLNTRYDQAINADRAKLKILDPELRLSQTGYNLAKKRYLQFEGELIDVREALRNLLQVESDSIEVRSDLFRNLALKMVVNGAHV